jgi:hypothetical protein
MWWQERKREDVGVYQLGVIVSQNVQTSGRIIRPTCIRKVGISLFCLISSFDLFLPFSSFCLLNKSEKENISIKRRIRNIKKNSNF